MIHHLACIMDGNRRWAKKQGQLAWFGHQAGIKTVQMVIDFAIKHKISYLSLYTFSLENFNRSQVEKSYLFELIMSHAEQYVTIFIEKNIKIRFLGDISKFPDSIIAICQKVEQQTYHCNSLYVNFLFGYGSQQEIFHAARLLSQDAVHGKVVTKELFETHLFTDKMPNPDLIIRTGGVQRLSNFLLYQSAYAEIRFLDTLWPDFSETELLNTVTHAVQAQKNFGV